MSGKQLVALDGPDSASLPACSNLDGRFLAVTRTGPKVTSWELARPQVTCQALAPYGLGMIVGIAFVPGERLLVLGAKDGVRLWDRDTGRELAFLPTGETQVVVPPDGKSIITGGDRGLHRWPLVKVTEPGQDPVAASILRLGPPESLAPGGSYWGVQLAADGRTLAAVDRDRGRGILIDLQTMHKAIETGSHTGARHAALSPDGRWLATGPSFWADSVTKVWDARTGQLVRELPRELVAGPARVVFSPRGAWLVSATAHGYRFWEPGTWQPRHSLERLRANALEAAIAFTPDGKLAAVARTGGLVQLIDPATGNELANLEVAEQYNIYSLQFSPDGSQLVAGRDNHLMHIWDLRKIREQLAIIGLDWDWPPYPPAAPSGDGETLRVEVDLGELAPRPTLPRSGN